MRNHDAFVKQGFLAVVVIKWRHNHQIQSADALSYRLMSESVKNQFMDHFQAGNAKLQEFTLFGESIINMRNFRSWCKRGTCLVPESSGVDGRFQRGNAG